MTLNQLTELLTNKIFTIMATKFKKVTITATDEMGRTEKITLKLEIKTANILRKSVSEYLLWLREEYEYNHNERNTKLSKKQYYKIENFIKLITCKFYKYTLTAN